jgi:hypothetical protein
MIIIFLGRRSSFELKCLYGPLPCGTRIIHMPFILAPFFESLVKIINVDHFAFFVRGSLAYFVKLYLA